jgi:hypothetical protein
MFFILMSNDIGFKGNININGDVTLTSPASSYKIDGMTVLTSDKLGPTIVKSYLTELGTLSSLKVSGNTELGNTTASTITATELKCNKVSFINLTVTSSLTIGSNTLKGNYKIDTIGIDRILYKNLEKGIYLLYFNLTLNQKNITGVFVIDNYNNNIDPIYIFPQQTELIMTIINNNIIVNNIDNLKIVKCNLIRYI